MKYSPWFLLTLGCTLNGQTPVTAVANTIRTAVDTRHAAESVERVYSTDRWFTFPAFEKTAAYLESRLKQVGLENIEIGGATADGVTQAGFWTMPLAWDAIRARLELTSPASEVLCDYRSVPTCLGMWSGSTPIAGIDAELVEFKSTPREQLKGKFVLTEKNAANLKYELVQAGALGAVNAFTENPDLQDDRQWVNAWGDYGWGFTKTSTPLLCYSITPRQAKRLRDLLASGQKVMLRAQADTRFYAGRYPWVTAVLPGSEPGEEVLTLGHTSEQGAHDNATGRIGDGRGRSHVEAVDRNWKTAAPSSKYSCAADARTLRIAQLHIGQSGAHENDGGRHNGRHAGGAVRPRRNRVHALHEPARRQILDRRIDRACHGGVPSCGSAVAHIRAHDRNRRISR